MLLTRKQAWRKASCRVDWAPSGGSSRRRRATIGSEEQQQQRGDEEGQCISSSHTTPPLRVFARVSSDPLAVEKYLGVDGLPSSSHRPLVTSFSDRSLPRSASGDLGEEQSLLRAPTRVRRAVSDECMTESRKLFGASQAPPRVSSAPAMKRKVSFESRVKVVLIPTAKELPVELRMGLWWTKDDNISFQRSIFDLLPPGTDLSMNMLALGKFLDIAEGLHSSCQETPSEKQQQHILQSSLPVSSLPLPSSSSASVSPPPTLLPSMPPQSQAQEGLPANQEEIDSLPRAEASVLPVCLCR